MSLCLIKIVTRSRYDTQNNDKRSQDQFPQGQSTFPPTITIKAKGAAEPFYRGLKMPCRLSPFSSHFLPCLTFPPFPSLALSFHPFNINTNFVWRRKSSFLQQPISTGELSGFQYLRCLNVEHGSEKTSNANSFNILGGEIPVEPV